MKTTLRINDNGITVDVVVPNGKLGLQIGDRGTIVNGLVECRHEPKYTSDGRLTYWYYWYIDGRGKFASGTESARVLHRVRKGDAVVVSGRVAKIINARCVA